MRPKGLKGPILELIRGLYDRGDLARADDDSRPAFGGVLVGNSTFPGKGGNQRLASFEPLTLRVTHDITLPGPAKVEFAALAAGLFPAPGNLRVMTIAALTSPGSPRRVHVLDRTGPGRS